MKTQTLFLILLASRSPIKSVSEKHNGEGIGNGEENNCEMVMGENNGGGGGL